MKNETADFSLFHEDFSALPQPKVKKSDRTGQNEWCPFYAAFSSKFALAALRFLQPTAAEKIYDPFVGSGTSITATRQLFLPLIANDLDPISILMSRAKAANALDHQSVDSLLARKGAPETTVYSEEAQSLFTPSDLDFSGSLLSRIAADLGAFEPGPPVFHQILSVKTPETDLYALVLAALASSARLVAQTVGGSNPVWFRKAFGPENIPTPPLSQLFRTTLCRYLKDLRDLPHVQARQFQFINQDATISQTSLLPDGVSVLLTSPPYPNRLDYIVNHLAELTVLSPLLPQATEQLRSRLIGTVKAVNKIVNSRNPVGPRCLALLENIRNHPSYASERYYYPFYRSYFDRLHRALQIVFSSGTDTFRGILVVQNSYYKELEIPLIQIVSDWSESADLKTRVISSRSTAAHIGQLSPQQRKSVPHKKLNEAIIHVFWG